MEIILIIAKLVFKYYLDPNIFNDTFENFTSVFSKVTNVNLVTDTQ